MHSTAAVLLLRPVYQSFLTNTHMTNVTFICRFSRNQNCIPQTWYQSFLVKSAQTNFKNAKNNKLMFLYINTLQKGVLFFQASWAVSPFLANLEHESNTLCQKLYVEYNKIMHHNLQITAYQTIASNTYTQQFNYRKRSSCSAPIWLETEEQLSWLGKKNTFLQNFDVQKGEFCCFSSL